MPRIAGRASRGVVGAVIAAGMLVLAGCAGMPWVKTVACPGWVHFETPADAADDAAAAFVGTVLERDGTARTLEVEMSAWSVEVDAVLAGDAVAEGEVVRVVSMADPCSGEAVYEEGDPLAAIGDELLIFVNAYDGALWTPTPYQGVLPAPADGRIPAEWPAD